MRKISILPDKIIETLRSVEGGSVRKKAAKILGISERTLQKNMNNYGITFRDWRPKKEHIKRKGWGGYKLNRQKAQDIREMFENGEKIKNIAKNYNVTFSAISRIINNITYKENRTRFGGEAKVNVEYRP